jgi:hypothetical protein
MDLEFDITQSFSDDMASLSGETRRSVVDQINLISQSLLNGQTEFKENSSIPYIFNLKNHLDSSLFLVKADHDSRMIVSVDEDPVFDKISLTFFRLVDKGKADEVYKQVGENIYKGLGIL